MTDKQEKFIENLVDQLGYKNSPLRQQFLNCLFKYSPSIGFASEIIENLLQLNKDRKFSLRKPVDFGSSQKVTDIAQFAFCPVSYSIKRSYKEGDPTSKQIVVDSPKSILIEWINSFRSLNEFQKKRRNDNKIITSLLDANLMFDGYSPESQPYYNHFLNVSGKPHLILELNDDRIVVVEKRTYKDHPYDNLHHNNLIQALCYLFMFPELKCNKAIVIYWSNSYELALDKEYEIISVERNEETIQTLVLELKKFKYFLYERQMKFDVSQLNVNKCFRCNVKAICNHKSAMIDNLSMPYSTPDFDKKYPLFYTLAEEGKVISRELREDFIKDDQSILDETLDKRANIVHEEYWSKLIKSSLDVT